MPVTSSEPTMSVEMPNRPRRGNHPSAVSCDRSIWARKLTASPMMLRTMKAEIRIETIAARNRTPRTMRSLRRRVGDPVRSGARPTGIGLELAVIGLVSHRSRRKERGRTQDGSPASDGGGGVQSDDQWLLVQVATVLASSSGARLT